MNAAINPDEPKRLRRGAHSCSMNPSRHYTLTAISLHWLLAAAILGTFAVGLYMTSLPFSPARLKLFNWHKWAGVSILALSALRLLWRLRHPPPAELPMPAWQSQLARWAQGSMYLLFFALPLAGWAYSSASGFPIVVFGWLPLPDFVPVSRDLASALKFVHHWLAYGLAALVALHVAGALKHQFIDRDGLLQRMRPSRR